MAEWIKILLGTEVSLRPGQIVLDGTQLPHGKGQTTSPLLAHIYCGETGGWIKIPLSTEVGLGQGVIVKWEPSSPSRKSTQHPSPTFRPIFIVARRSSISATAELVKQILKP